MDERPQIEQDIEIDEEENLPELTEEERRWFPELNRQTQGVMLFKLIRSLDSYLANDEYPDDVFIFFPIYLIPELLNLDARVGADIGLVQQHNTSFCLFKHF